MTSRWRWWAVRAIVLFAGVALLGVLHVPTLIPYLAAIFIVGWDAIRTTRS